MTCTCMCMCVLVINSFLQYVHALLCNEYLIVILVYFTYVHTYSTCMYVYTSLCNQQLIELLVYLTTLTSWATFGASVASVGHHFTLLSV